MNEKKENNAPFVIYNIIISCYIETHNTLNKHK